MKKGTKEQIFGSPAQAAKDRIIMCEQFGAAVSEEDRKIAECPDCQSYDGSVHEH